MEFKLAKGLSNRFLREFKSKHDLNEENLRRRLKFFFDRRDGRTSARDWIKIINIFSSASNTVMKLQTGRAKKTELYRINIEPADLNPLKDWDELAIVGVISKLSLRSAELIEGDVVFSLSQHCIQRIFERKIHTISSFDLETFDHKIIIEELSYVSIYAALMRKFATELDNYMTVTVDYVLDGSKFNTNLPILIPSETGIFLGEFQDGVLLLRTFLHRDQISDVQKIMNNSIVEVLGPICRSPIAIHPYMSNSFRQIEVVTIDFMISVYLYQLTSVYMEHLNHIFKGDEEQKRVLKTAVRDFFRSDQLYKFQAGVAQELSARTFEENLRDLTKIMRSHVREEL